jgi:gamma-glutamyltranspeptidase / glutathione hydrolase
MHWPLFAVAPSATEVVTDGALVVGPDQRIADAGAAVIREGGNAVDAAVAAGFATGVVEPWAAGLGGSATITIAMRDPARCAVVEGHMVSPSGVRIEQYPLASAGVGEELIEQAFGLAPVVDQANLYGARAVTTPGAVACLVAAHDTYGRLPRAKVLEPAIALAADGFRINYLTAAYIAGVAGRIAGEPGLAEIFLPEGLPLRGPGASIADRLRQPALARTLEAIAAGGAEAFYKGRIARSIVDRVRRDGGALDLDDLEGYRATVVEPPLRVRFRDLDLIGAPRTGLPTIAEALYLYDAMAPGKDAAAHAVAWARAFYLAFGDRARYLTHDPSFPVPWEGLRSMAYALARLQAELTGGEAPDPGAFSSNGPVGGSARPASGHPGHTSHLTAVDSDGNIASLTSTLLNTFGSLTMDSESGVVLNGGMAYFDPRPGAINSIKPGVTVLSAMTPLILADDRRGPFAGLGAAGGRMIISGISQIVAALSDPVSSLQEAIEAPRIHAESKSVLLETTWPEEAANAVAAAGFEVRPLPEGPTTGNFARPNGIVVGPDGRRHSGVDPKKPAGVAVL